MADSPPVAFYGVILIFLALIIVPWLFRKFFF
jgi:hypothetical protein